MSLFSETYDISMTIDCNMLKYVKIYSHFLNSGLVLFRGFPESGSERFGKMDAVYMLLRSHVKQFKE